MRAREQEKSLKKSQIKKVQENKKPVKKNKKKKQKKVKKSAVCMCASLDLLPVEYSKHCNCIFNHNFFSLKLFSL